MLILEIMRTTVFISFVLFFATPLAAQEAASLSAEADVRRVVATTTPITRRLGGSKAGELILNTKVEVKETRGAWARVSVDGWVRTKALSEPPASADEGSAPTGTSTIPVIEDGALSITDYVSTHRSDVDPPRQYLMLTIENKGPQTINSWKALLVGQKDDGRILFREPISQDDVTIEPGATADVSFFWEPHEELYSVLGALTKDKLKLNLIKVESN